MNLVFYGLAGVIRLGYFNVMETKRQSETDEARKYYQGLPITSMAIALPLLFVVSPLLHSHLAFEVILHILVAVVGLLFITNFRVRKLSVKELILLVSVIAAAVLVILFAWQWWWRTIRGI